MKRKEREHLKEDPFQVFIEKAIELLRKYKKEIYIGLIAAVTLIVIVLVVLFFRSTSISSENRLYSEALSIKESQTLTLDQKIEKLNRLKNKKGISSSIKLLVAALYYEKGDAAKAKEVLDTFRGSKFKLINDHKSLLEADILSSLDKKSEAADLLNRVYADAESTVAKDYLLLKLARLQAGTGQTGTAITNLKKIAEEFPQSPYNRDANELLKKLEQK
ncbi:MAG: tetratricopeptide repeat protein [Candidatus Aminicenantes bacterium]|nr:tetratricopeptide repeat protein [Candidatus Aminicenantes bacterium]